MKSITFTVNESDIIIKVNFKISFYIDRCKDPRSFTLRDM